MFRTLLFAVVICAGAPSIARAQDPAAPAAADTTDPATRNIVTSYSIKSGRLILSSAANPGRIQMPDGTYTNESGVVLVFADGSVTRLQRGESINEISNTRLNRQKLVLLTPSTNALMAVSDITLPSGTFKSPDEQTWIRVVIGRPAEFVIGPAPIRQ
jgi:hypothetical protein